MRAGKRHTDPSLRFARRCTDLCRAGQGAPTPPRAPTPTPTRLVARVARRRPLTAPLGAARPRHRSVALCAARACIPREPAAAAAPSTSVTAGCLPQSRIAAEAAAAAAAAAHPIRVTIGQSIRNAIQPVWHFRSHLSGSHACAGGTGTGTWVLPRVGFFGTPLDHQVALLCYATPVVVATALCVCRLCSLSCMQGNSRMFARAPRIIKQACVSRRAACLLD